MLADLARQTKGFILLLRGRETIAGHSADLERKTLESGFMTHCTTMTNVEWFFI